MTVAKKKATAPSAPAKAEKPAGALSAVPAKAAAKVPPSSPPAPPRKKAPLDDGITAALLKGDPSAMLLGDSKMSIKIRGVISTQVPTIDYAIGRGGIPSGRLTILHGGEGSGKTTLALHLAAETQRQGGRVYYIDKEHKLDLDYANAVGVDVDAMYYSTPNHLEGAFDVMGKVIEVFAAHAAKTKKRVPHLIVLDSMNAAISKAEFEGEWTDQHMAPQARVYSRLLPKLIPLVAQTDVALLWISQVRQKMNVTYGDADEIAGGKSARFYASLIIDVKKIGVAKEGDEKIGSKVKIACKKNQIAVPFKEAEVEISYGRGFNKTRALIDLAEGHGLIEKDGSWFAYKGERLGQGYVNACEYLDGPGAEIRDAIWKELRGLLKW